jgi:organic hydroperoxide reductase OsmC/OhrA
MDEVKDDGHQIVGSLVHITAEEPELDQASFAAAVERAEQGCPFSVLLRRAGATVTVDAELTGAGKS